MTAELKTWARAGWAKVLTRIWICGEADGPNALKVLRKNPSLFCRALFWMDWPLGADMSVAQRISKLWLRSLTRRRGCKSRGAEKVRMADFRIGET